MHDDWGYPKMTLETSKYMLVLNLHELIKTA